MNLCFVYNRSGQSGEPEVGRLAAVCQPSAGSLHVDWWLFQWPKNTAGRVLAT